MATGLANAGAVWPAGLDDWAHRVLIMEATLDALARTNTKSVPSMPAPHRSTITSAARSSGARLDNPCTEIDGAT